MIQYSRLTLGQVIDECFQQTTLHRTNQNLDWTTVAFFVNRSIQEVLSKTLKLKDWCYVSTLNINSNPYRLPDGAILNGRGTPKYMDKIRLIYEHREARYADPKEFYKLTDSMNAQSWNKSDFNNPIYTIWGGIPRDNNGIVRDSYLNQSPMYLYISPYDPTVFENITEGTSAIDAMFECYLMPPDLMNASDVIPVPYEFEDLIILYTITRILSKLGVGEKLSEEIKRMLSEERRITDSYMERIKMKEQVIESFEDSQPREITVQILDTASTSNGTQATNS